MVKLYVRDLGSVREALAEAARTDENSAPRAVERYIELRGGMADKLGARRHHMLTGRRGTGKSTLLQVVRKRLSENGVAVASIDMERFKGPEFPDVLIEILVSLLNELRPELRARHFASSIGLRLRARKFRRELSRALVDPQSVVHRHNSHTRRGAGAKGAIGAGLSEEGVALEVKLASGKTAVSTDSTEAEYEELKIERLQQLAPRIAILLTDLVSHSTEKQAIVFIDDYYFVKLNDQPQVLDYLHQVCKGTGVWLKIGGVGSRLRPYKDGNPPVGMQPSQDIDRLALDVTLNDFGTAQRFLEEMLQGILRSKGLSAKSLFTDTARSRMVLACGGAVARDYITLTDAALDEAAERMSKSGEYKDDAVVQIGAEDVNRAARKRLNMKEEQDLSIDAGSDAPLLSIRWRDLCDFTRESGGIAFVLVRQTDLDGTEWGQEVQQLENLRLLHRIKDTVPNTPNWRGVKTIAFMVDLAQVADQRLRTGIPEFWKSTAEFDKLRRAEWVYTPGWREHQAKNIAEQKKADGRKKNENVGLNVDTAPEPLFDL